MKFALRLTVALAVALMTCFCVAETTVLGQGFGPRGSSNRDDDNSGRAGRGFASPSGFGPSLFGSSMSIVRPLYTPETRAELGLSADDLRKVQEAARDAMYSASADMRVLLDKMRNAGSVEEREKLQKEYRDAIAERNKNIDEVIAKSIGAEKMLRLKQLSLQYEGGRALMRDDVAADLNITDAQKAKLEDLSNQRRDAFREMGFRANPEERAAFEKEWDEKYFSILTDEQREKWAQKVGRIVAQTVQAAGGGTPSPSRTTGRSNSGGGSSGISGRGSLGGSTIGRSSGVVGALYRVETRAELGLSDDEISKLQEAARDAVSSGSADMRVLLDKMRNAGSVEEREKIQKEIRDSFEERSKKAEEAIAKSIGAEKMLRLKQLALQYDGGLALMRDDVASDLNITDAQKAKFAELRNQSIQARRELGVRASPEERVSFEKEWDEKYFSILTDEQRAKWEQKVGRIVTPRGRKGDNDASEPK